MHNNRNIHKNIYFPLTLFFYCSEQIASENTRNFLRGKWIENIENKETTDKIKIVFLPPRDAIIYNFRNQDSLFFNSVVWCREWVLLNNCWTSPNHRIFYLFEFQKIGKDTINVDFRLRFDDDVYYSTQMIREVDSPNYRKLRQLWNEN